MSMQSEEQPLSTADIAGRSPTQPSEAPVDPSGPRPSTNSLGTDETELARNEPAAEGPPTRPSPDDTAAPLFAAEDGERFHSRWTDVQAGFVDDPRNAVEQADGLVAEVVKNLAQAFADERSGLEQQWQKGEDVSTEDLRQALRRYRSFFDRLLSV